LAPGESKTVTLTLHPELPEGPSPTLAFPAVLVTDSFEPDGSNNVVSIATPFVPDTQIAIKPTLTSPFPTPVGQDLTYALNLQNVGPNPATGVVVYQTLPDGTTFVSATLRGDPIAGVVDGRALRIAIPDERSLARLNVTLSTAGIAVPATATPISTPIEVTWNESPEGVRGVVGLGSIAPRGYVGSLLDQMFSSIHTNQYQIYSYTVSNPDTFTATGLSAVLTFPPASTLGVAPGDYTVERTPTSQIVTIHLGELAAGETRRLVVETVAVSPAPAGIEALAKLLQEGRPENFYPTTSVTTTIVPAVHLVATLSPREFTPDGKLVRTIAVTNQGPNTATGVKVEWKIPGPRGPHGEFDPNQPFSVESVPVGTVEVGQTVIVDVSQFDNFSTTYFDGLHPVANEPDALPFGSTMERAAYGFVSRLSAGAASVETGELATFTMRTMNVGPVDAEDLRLIAEIPARTRLVAATPGVVVVGNQVMLDVADLPVGSLAEFQYVVSPTWDALASGVLTAQASVSAWPRGLDSWHNGQTSATVAVTAGPSGELVPGSASYEAPEDAGSIVITVNRVGGVSGRMTLDYATEAVNAVPGVDFLPGSGTLVFEDGETSRTITVPILTNPHSAVDHAARVVFSNGQTALLTIRDVDHERPMPAVADVQWVGPPRRITAIHVALAWPLPSSTALDASAFMLVGAGGGSLYGAGGDRPVPLRSAYIPATSTVVLTPRRPLTPNRFYRLTAAGGGLAPGTDYAASLARGWNLRYLTTVDDLVRFRLRGAGYIDALLTGPNQDERLSVVSLGPRRASVSRNVVKVHPRGLGAIHPRPPSRPPLARNWFATSAMHGSS